MRTPSNQHQVNNSPTITHHTHLRRQVVVDVTLFKLEADQKRHLVTHVKSHHLSQWGRLGKVLQVLKGEGEGNVLLKLDRNAKISRLIVALLRLRESEKGKVIRGRNVRDRGRKQEYKKVQRSVSRS